MELPIEYHMAISNDQIDGHISYLLFFWETLFSLLYLIFSTIVKERAGFLENVVVTS